MPPAIYVKLRVAHAPGMPGTFSPPPLIGDPDMHHGTRVTHVPWCMPGSLTSGFLWSRWREKRSRHSRCNHNRQFYVSGKRPIVRMQTDNSYFYNIVSQCFTKTKHIIVVHLASKQFNWPYFTTWCPESEYIEGCGLKRVCKEVFCQRKRDTYFAIYLKRLMVFVYVFIDHDEYIR